MSQDMERLIELSELYEEQKRNMDEGVDDIFDKGIFKPAFKAISNTLKGRKTGDKIIEILGEIDYDSLNESERETYDDIYNNFLGEDDD